MGQDDVTLTNNLSGKTFNNLMELITQIKRYEDIKNCIQHRSRSPQYSRERYQPYFRGNQERKGNVGRVFNCYNCNKPRHFAKNCYSKTATEEKLPMTTEKPININKIDSIPEINCFLKKVIINGIEFRGLIQGCLTEKHLRAALETIQKKRAHS